MSAAMEAMRLRIEADRRNAILEAVVGVSLLVMSIICAARGEAWHGALVGIASGAFLSAAGFTAIRALTWRREADKRALKDAGT